jgi:hypothetical protein
MEGLADLHMHTTHSDGTLSVESLLRAARRAGLSVVSITDHDTVNGLPAARRTTRELGMDLVAGVELSTTLEGLEVHLLAYAFDPENSDLAGYLASCRRERRSRAERIVEKLHALNVPVQLETVLRRAGHGSIGRPHIAHALVEEGHTGTFTEAFARYLATGRPAYEEKRFPEAAEAVALVRAAGGVCCIAHPGDMDHETIRLLLRAGVEGVEVVHPSHTTVHTERYARLAREQGLLVTGGSDFHAARDPRRTLGRYTIEAEQVRRLLEHAAGPERQAVQQRSM